ncbi:hypothetical protein FA13DRAFT_1726262 [Coprinellus micaceus]|uniref:F-box domain-containing protein n=1 Tax=Coprinellus micaceus TaxID=71717 RepID=A0A4Y7TSH2_COPMI|nr:hypothetical protein FA13DRAFT_1726262 [Coprinellus micaceus]
MKEFEAAQRVIDAQIEQVDADIAQCRSNIELLEAEKVELKRRRNALAPIATLPPEIITQIFSSSLTRIPHSELSAFHHYSRDYFVPEEKLEDVQMHEVTYQALLRPNIFTLCHISHGWKETAVGCQRLWSSIQVQPKTSPEVVSMMWRNAGELPVALDFVALAEDRETVDPRSFPVFSLLRDLLQSKIDRFKSIGIYCFEPELVNALHGRAGHLEALVVVGKVFDWFDDPVAYDQLVMGGAPNLRRLEVKGLTIPWASPLLALSPRLTHVVLTDPPVSTPESIADLVSFLRRLPNLNYLKLEIQIENDFEEGMVFSLARTADRTPIYFPKLHTLDLCSDDSGPIAAILSLLHVPRDIHSLTIICGTANDPNLDEAVLKISSCGRDPSDYVSPEEVEIDSLSATCWREQQFKWQVKGCGMFSRNTLALESKPAWVYIRAGNLMPRVPWSFTRLRSISVLCLPAPDDFWTTLSTLESLEIVRVGAPGAEPFFKALSKEPTRGAGASPNSSYGRSAAQVEAQANLSVTSFPALRAVWFEQWSSDGSQLLGGSAGSPTIADHTMTFVERFVGALKTRGSPVHLEETRIRSSPSDWLPHDALNILFPVTQCFIWGDRVYVRNLAQRGPLNGQD